MKGKTEIKTNSNRVSKKERNLNSAHRSDICWSSVHFDQMHGKIHVEQIAENSGFSRIYDGIHELRIVTTTKEKVVILDTTYVFDCIEAENYSNFQARYYKFFDIKSITIEGTWNENMTVLLEMI